MFYALFSYLNIVMLGCGNNTVYSHSIPAYVLTKYEISWMILAAVIGIVDLRIHFSACKEDQI